MSKILRVSESDYRVKVQNGGNITLDTGLNTGVVTITGNLVVQGDYTTINVQDMQIEDNILLLNKGESGNGVTEVTSGIEIDRGNYTNVQFVWDEDSTKFRVQDKNGVLQPLTVDSLATDSGLNLKFDMNSGSGTLRLINTTGYESRVLDDNDIPNKKYVNDYVFASGGSAQVDKIRYPVNASAGFEDTLVQAYLSSIRMYVRSGGVLNKRVQVTNLGVDIDNINIYGDTITNTYVDPGFQNNLILTSTNNNVEIDAVLNLDDQLAPTATGGTSRLYSMSDTAATNFELYNSGVFVANSRTQDELVAKNRALLLSILF